MMPEPEILCQRRRLQIDERVGCIAVVDADRVSSPGLGPDYPGVLWFAHGRHVTRWDRLIGRAGEHDIWIVPPRLRRMARRRLASLMEVYDA